MPVDSRLARFGSGNLQQTWSVNLSSSRKESASMPSRAPCALKIATWHARHASDTPPPQEAQNSCQRRTVNSNRLAFPPDFARQRTQPVTGGQTLPVGPHKRDSGSRRLHPDLDSARGRRNGEFESTNHLRGVSAGLEGFHCMTCTTAWVQADWSRSPSAARTGWGRASLRHSTELRAHPVAAKR